MTTLSPLFTWRSAIADSDLDATAKHVALTLSLHMNERGDSAFPSLSTQAAETSRSKGTVSEALRRLSHAGWLTIQRPERKGRGHVSRYRAVVPERVLRANLSEKGTPTETVRSDDETVRSAKRKGTAVVPEDVKRERQEDVGRSPNAQPVKSDATRRDLLFEAVMEVSGILLSEIPDAARGRYGKAVATLRGLEATPEEVRRRAGHAWFQLTPSSLASRWAELRRPPGRNGKPGIDWDARAKRAEALDAKEDAEREEAERATKRR